MRKITLFATFAFVAMLSSQVLAAAPTGLYDVIFGTASTSISVQATDVKKQTVTVQILNEYDEYIVNEKFANREDFVRKYDLINMKDGEYQLIINKSNHRITQPFAVYGGYVQLSELEKQTMYFPVVNVHKHNVDVNIFSEKYGDIIVNILDDKNETVFTNTVSDEHLMHKRYNTKKLPRGAYTVEVIVHGERFYFDLEK